ncbi:hypothetical protein Leryth_024303 [Lithospermum erythrorhizon]|nr:hypothetical protein Leryth_024303 [Lithospermum erythrorhizon]
MDNFDSGLSCSSLIPPADEADDISVFVKQILLRSSTKNSNVYSSPSTSSFVSPKCNAALDDSVLPVSGSMEVYCPATAAFKSSTCTGIVDNETDGYDGESEDEFVEEVPTKPNPERSSSKRSRAAEIHNLSEKRRRSRINEKMKALQNLIPNSNKTDKASMLDQAIEYLKQLQLQVQMLTMRNGFSLHPAGLPGVLNQDQFSQMEMGFVQGNGQLNTSTSFLVPVRQHLLRTPLKSLPNIHTTPKGIQVSNCSPAIDVADSFGLETSHVVSSSLAYKGIQRLEESGLEPINEGYPTRNPIEYSEGRITPFMDDSIACLLVKRQAEYAHFKELEHKPTMSPLTESIGIHGSLHTKKEFS